jgi:hypothetical protein
MLTVSDNKSTQRNCLIWRSCCAGCIMSLVLVARDDSFISWEGVHQLMTRQSWEAGCVTVYLTC